jgi:hypothetical protein
MRSRQHRQHRHQHPVYCLLYTLLYSRTGIVLGPRLTPESRLVLWRTSTTLKYNTVRSVQSTMYWRVHRTRNALQACRYHPYTGIVYNGETIIGVWENQSRMPRVVANQVQNSILFPYTSYVEPEYYMTESHSLGSTHNAVTLPCSNYLGAVLPYC